MRNEWDWHTLQPTALVHERLIPYHLEYENREHFLNVAAAAMRLLLIDYARKKKSFKRGENQERTLLNDGQTAVSTLLQSPEELIDLDYALESLRPEQVRAVELRYFAGLTVEETAATLHIEVETLKKRWRVIKLLLCDRLKGRNHGPS